MDGQFHQRFLDHIYCGILPSLRSRFYIIETLNQDWILIGWIRDYFANKRGLFQAKYDENIWTNDIIIYVITTWIKLCLTSTFGLSSAKFGVNAALIKFFDGKNSMNQLIRYKQAWTFLKQIFEKTWIQCFFNMLQS